MYVGARYYEVETGRWVQKDPILGETDSYVYAMNNPLAFIDSTDMYWETLIDIGFVAYDISQGNWIDVGIDIICILLPIPAAVGKIDDLIKRGWPKKVLPGYSPKWLKKGGVFTNPKSGERWKYHPEDKDHYAHWDVEIPKRGKVRIPVDPEKGVFKRGECR